MPRFPLLPLPVPEAVVPREDKKRGPDIAYPKKLRQVERLSPKFSRLEAVADDPQKLLELREDPASIAPERAIVFEINGAIDTFYDLATSIGLDFLDEQEDQILPDEDFFDKKHPEKILAGRLYFAMPDTQALKELLSLWKLYKKGNMPRGKGKWTPLFKQLHDIRAWGAGDRIDAESIEAWKEDLSLAPDDMLSLEVEFWFYETSEKREQAFQRIRNYIDSVEGKIVFRSTIEEIRYHAALIKIKRQHAEKLINDRSIALALNDDVMFLRPQSFGRIDRAEDEERETSPTAPAEPSFLSREPVAALFDGFPVQNHIRLQNRINIDDPEDIEGRYPASRRIHGTEMASLIVWGDLNRDEAAIPRPLYVRPIFEPTTTGDEEQFISSTLIVDLIYMAVRRMKEVVGGEPAAAPSVLFVNLSIGDPRRPFARAISPLAKLLDYLSYKYGILFLISAGNIKAPLPIKNTSLAAFEALSKNDRERLVLSALNENKSQRTLLSPAEAVNALTIGAAHDGNIPTTGWPNSSWLDPFSSSDLPNVMSAMGLGFKKTVKPDLLLRGGRIPVTIQNVNPAQRSLTVNPLYKNGTKYFGIKTACPSSSGSNNAEHDTIGTSVSTALATRSAHLLYDALTDGDGGSYHSEIDKTHLSLIVKALLAHGAKWGDSVSYLDEFFEPQGQGSHPQRRDDIARLLGYGIPDVTRVLDCAENRATLVGYGEISQDIPLLYKIPLPEGLNGVKEYHACTVTLAWFTPINPKHRAYRSAALDVSSGSNDKYWFTPKRNGFAPTDKAITRGTLFHECRISNDANVFADDGLLLLRVSCRATGAALTAPVPFALAITLEVGVDSQIKVYEQVKEPLLTRIRAPVRAG